MSSTSEVIRLANEAGFEKNRCYDVILRHSNGSWINCLEQVARLISLAKAEEREACAVAACSTGMDLHMKSFDAREIGSRAAQVIRARTWEAP